MMYCFCWRIFNLVDSKFDSELVAFSAFWRPIFGLWPPFGYFITLMHLIHYIYVIVKIANMEVNSSASFVHSQWQQFMLFCATISNTGMQIYNQNTK